MATIRIKDREIGPTHPPLVIAEIGINHNGILDVAIGMADSAISAGAEVVKHQTHIVEDEMSDEAKQVIPGNADRSIFQIMESCALSEEDELSLMKYVEQKGAIYLSTPFSRAAVERLERFNVSAYKIGSGECNNFPLVRLIASTGKPIIVSTGMNSYETIDHTVNILRFAKVDFALLHCTNIYPTPPELVRLGALTEMQSRYPDVVIGLSDHTVNNYACLGAVALGASILERHFTDYKSREGPDISCSMDPDELKELIYGANFLYKERGGIKGRIAEEAKTEAFAYGSVIATVDLVPGDALSEGNIWVRRPAGGDFTPGDYDSLIVKVSKKFVKANMRIKKADFDE